MLRSLRSVRSPSGPRGLPDSIGRKVKPRGDMLDNIKIGLSLVSSLDNMPTEAVNAEQVLSLKSFSPHVIQGLIPKGLTSCRYKRTEVSTF